MAPLANLLGLVTGVLCLFSSPGATYKEKPSVFTFTPGSGGFQLGGPSLAPEIRVSQNDAPGVLRAARDLAADFGRVLGTNGTVVVADWAATIAVKTASRPTILIGTVGQSSLIDGLISSKKLDASAITKKWETFTYQVVPTPWEGRDNVFVIAGSDSRGAVFGIYDIAERIGVSPLHYWADVQPIKRQHIAASTLIHTEGPPSVKYRGIFLNDEAPALTGWGGSNFKRSQYGSPFVSDFYRHIFDLILRLKGNYLWPAMWSSMFYLDDPKNGPLATEYGIFMGTSHHEPMARADKEQGRFLRGSWDWRSNKAGVQSFMQEGATRSKDWSTIYTLGMRGSGDAASATLSSSSLEEIIAWQQQTLTKTLGKPLSEIPQAWVMYKEVPGYWQAGMKVSDDVTLLWSDDNRGNIRRVPIGDEEKRSGGSGMYYHFDYVGDPRNYKWINTIQLTKTWEQMTLTYDSGIRNIWIANVGDLKALELPTVHFMALAWDREAFSGMDSTTEWLKVWSARQFGEDAAGAAAEIMTTYGKLTARHKYEDLSRTPFAFHATNYDEVELNYQEWVDLVAKAQAVYDKLPSAVQDSFFEIVLHPVLAGKTVFEIYSKVTLASRYSTEKRISTNQLAKDVQAAFQADQAITRRFHSLRGGKWNHFMDQTHLGYNNWQEPSSNTIPRASTLTAASSNALLGVAAQGNTAAYPGSARLSLAPVSKFDPPSVNRYIDIFARGDGTFFYDITANVSFVNVTNRRGSISSPAGPTDIRSILGVNWAAAPAGSSSALLTIVNTNATSQSATVVVPLENPTIPSDFKGHVEADATISIEAEHFSPADSSKEYAIIPNYGRTLSGVRLPPRTASQQPGKGPVLVYPFYSFTNIADATVTVYLAPSENANPKSPNRYSVSVDGGAVSTVQVVALTNGSNQPQGWSDAVIRGAYVKSSKVGRIAPGKHELKLYLLEPTMVVTKVVIDFGGVKSSLLGPPESWRSV
ncbi:hypothetical protein B0T16DRAFT_322524 [Cercophora newfieldiana]|uniref:Gylcosyl hydrolase 115 C-terminal domain-containing protein n=1 Tax=Cercophora newfieldiana TaxID=92897 RepID=A0AA39YI66_9PEZI|nr:hypothetical protein B0T16DRAFT_322524 [Cercophora newfieldiana]